MKDIIKKAMDLAENEVQDKQIQYLKNIIKNLLQKKADREKEKDELEEEIKLIKQEIDDFKAGRLDKIKERHDINPKADKVCPIQITIINDNSKINYPTQPWKWNYQIETTYPPSITSNGTLTKLGNTTYTVPAIYCGSTTATYAVGTYSINGGSIVNL